MTTALEMALQASGRAGAAAGAQDECFAALLRGQHPHLVRLVRRLLAWPAQGAEIDDVLQDVYLAAWTRRADFRGEGPPAAWLGRIAVHTARNHARAARRRRRLAALFGLWPPVGAPPPADETPSRVRDAVARLAHRDREVLVLRYLEQRSGAEVAALLGLSRNALDARLCRARRRLGALLGEAGAASGEAVAEVRP